MSDNDRIHFVDEMLRGMTAEADQAKARYELLPKMPKQMPEECKSLWTDAAFSFTFGRNYAALCVCGAFVECFLGKAIPSYQLQQGSAPSKLPNTFKELIVLGENIGLVAADEAKILHEFRELIRNRFAHGDAQAIADSLLKVKTATQVVVRQGSVQVRQLEPNELAPVITLTTASRMSAAMQAFAIRVIPWTGKWARHCAERAWHAPAPR